jgi:hypothetical protein
MTRMAYGLALAVALSACDGTRGKAVAVPDYVRAHDLHHLMEVLVAPQAEVFWNSSGTIANATGEHDLTPTTDAGWLATQSAAATIAEVGNLLMTPQFAEGRGGDWKQFSRSLVEVGMMAEQAAVDRSADAVLEVGATMDKVCEACHQVYLPGAGGTNNAELARGARRKGVLMLSDQAPAAEPGNRDQWEVELGAYESIELKYTIPEGERMTFSWQSSQPLHYDMHAHPFAGGVDLTESYGVADAATLRGRYVAPFTGIHGWYWQNRTLQPVKLTLAASGGFSTSTIFDSAGEHDRPVVPPAN